MDAEFLETMRRAYAEAVGDWNGPLVRVDCALQDLRQTDERGKIVELIRLMLEKEKG
jgi:hypothetical protein